MVILKFILIQVRQCCEKKPHNLGCAIACLIFLVLCPLYGFAATMGRATGSQDTTSIFGWERIRQAAVNAVVSPMKRVPAADALTFQVGHRDQKDCDWAPSTASGYGSHKNAGRVRDLSLRSSGNTAMTSIRALPITATETTHSAEVDSRIFMRQFDGGINENASRSRPSGRADLTFFSSPSPGKALDSTPICPNIEYFKLSSPAAPVSQINFVLTPAAGLPARDEAKRNYLSDVLVGAAIGRFFGVFITDAFPAGPLTPTSVITTETANLERVGLLLSLHWSF
jgi:hypothetical protein